MALLDAITCPADLRKLSMSELAELAAEMRDVIFNAVSQNGGHLASNLGVVELTIALHYVYDFGPYPTGPDRLLWDVGHQSYSHKLLTGRAPLFQRLRKRGSVSGFPSPDESAYDLFSVGHAGTAISTAVGMARADQHLGRDNHVVAVVGDASIVNGLSFEGLNGAGTLKRQMLMVLNDNGMSISQPQGAFAQYIERVRVSATYEEAKRFAKRIVDELPAPVGHTIEGAWQMFREGVKHAMWPGQVFEALGIKYFGPIDGHDLPGLINTLAEIQHVKAPLLLHVKTIKGHGHDVTRQEPTKFHSPAAFRVEGCRVEINKGSGKSWTTAFADAMIKLADSDPRVMALTAAMPDGTGLSKFEKTHPKRYIDTGICESHLAAMAAGMCKSGLRPFAAVYSTFTQRCFDQIWQEVVLNGQPVVFCMDRAGFVGDDGAVHHGFADQAFLRPLPGIVLMAPSDEAELNRSLRLALSLETASALRYPRDNVPATNFEDSIDKSLRSAASQEWKVGKSRTLREGDDATIIAYGALAQQAMLAAEELSADGISVRVVDARFCKPVDGEMLTRTLEPGHPVVTVEDHSLQNGFGTAVLEFAVAHRLPTESIIRLGMPDRLVAHATRKEQLAETGLDAAGIVRTVRDAVRAKDTATSKRDPISTWNFPRVVNNGVVASATMCFCESREDMVAQATTPRSSLLHCLGYIPPPMQLDIDRILIPQQKIAERVAELAQQITADHTAPKLDRPAQVTIVPILTGAMIFCSDLIRHIPIAMRIGVVSVSSYPGQSVTSQGAQVVAQQLGDLHGRRVVLVDDILDSGQTIRLVQSVLRQQGAASVKTCVLLRKDRPITRDVQVDYVGFDIPDEFVVGYGLDFDNYYRNLPDIVTLRSDVIEARS